jgi:II/X family phage/plasmid replication protein
VALSPASRGERIQRYDVATGEVRWETQAWDSMRSDSHGVAFQVGSDRLRFQGSPARAIADGNAVFGAGAAGALDVAGCVQAMGAVLGPGLDIALPGVECFNVTRVDVTQNILLSALADVRAALAILRNCEGGRYRVNQPAGDTVYWSKGSSLRSGKAYAKGPHLRHLMKQRDYGGRRYTGEEIRTIAFDGGVV